MPAQDVAGAEARHEAALRIAVDYAVWTGPHRAEIHIVAAVVAIGPAERPTRCAVVTGNSAVVAAIGRAAFCVVEIEVAVVAARGTAFRHVITEKLAAVTVYAVLVALVATRAGAPVGMAAPVARAPGQSGGAENKTNGEDESCEQPGNILSSNLRASKKDRVAIIQVDRLLPLAGYVAHPEGNRIAKMKHG